MPVQKFGDIKSASWKYPDAAKLTELMDQTFVIDGVEFSDKDSFRVSYLNVQSGKAGGKWYYSTSKVIRDQCDSIQKALRKGPVEVTLTERNGYHVFE